MKEDLSNRVKHCQ